jgi:hypothetical protein
MYDGIGEGCHSKCDPKNLKSRRPDVLRYGTVIPTRESTFERLEF